MKALLEMQRCTDSVLFGQLRSFAWENRMKRSSHSEMKRSPRVLVLAVVFHCHTTTHQGEKLHRARATQLLSVAHGIVWCD